MIKMSLEDEVLISVIDFVRSYRSEFNPDYGLQYLVANPELARKLAPGETIYQPYPISKNVPHDWDEGVIPTSIQALEGLSRLGVDFPVHYDSDSAAILNRFAAWTLFAGHINNSFAISLRVHSALLREGDKKSLKTIDDKLPDLLITTIENKRNDYVHVNLNRSAAVGRLVTLLDISAQGSRTKIPLYMPAYIMNALDELEGNQQANQSIRQLCKDFAEILFLNGYGLMPEHCLLQPNRTDLVDFDRQIKRLTKVTLGFEPVEKIEPEQRFHYYASRRRFQYELSLSDESRELVLTEFPRLNELYGTSK